MKRTKKIVMDELAEAIQERDWLEAVKIDRLKQELSKFKLSKSEMMDCEMDF